MVPLSERAIATSSGTATRFEASAQYHHLFSPASGRSANTYAAVSVAAQRATLADALSTALFVAPYSAANASSRKYPTSRRGSGPRTRQANTSSADIELDAGRALLRSGSLLEIDDQIGDLLIALQPWEHHLVTGNKLFRLLHVLGDRGFGPVSLSS